jgi:hypothetical protein
MPKNVHTMWNDAVRQQSPHFFFVTRIFEEKKAQIHN